MKFDSDRVVSVMSGFPGPWGIAGGWAIDLFLGRQTRVHADIDVAILREDQQHLRLRLPTAGVDKVVARNLVAWSAFEQLHPPIHEVHATWPDGYQLEFLLNEHDRETDEWLFRRDQRVHRSLAEAFAEAQGVPCLAPEIVLLYKSKTPSSRDDADFASALPNLGAARRSWLRDALELTAPGHRWATSLA